MIRLFKALIGAVRNLVNLFRWWSSDGQAR